MKIVFFEELINKVEIVDNDKKVVNTGYKQLIVVKIGQFHMMNIFNLKW